MHPAQLAIEVFQQQCRLQATRRSGPGGQHRNKVETAVIVTHVLTGIHAEAAERRSQAENRQVALGRLRVRLALEHRTAPALACSPRWVQRTAGGGIAVNQSHHDFAALLAELLDTLAAEGWDDAATAVRLGVTRTQLVRFLAREPLALQQLNAQRLAIGLPALRGEG